jgi:hypothetical protein
MIVDHVCTQNHFVNIACQRVAATFSANNLVGLFCGGRRRGAGRRRGYGIPIHVESRLLFSADGRSGSLLCLQSQAQSEKKKKCVGSSQM